MTELVDETSDETSHETSDETEAATPTETDVTPAEIAESPSATPASWTARAGAFAVDVLLGGGVALVFMLIAWSAPVFGWLWWLSVVVGTLVFLAVAVNRLVLPVITGWSLGRSLFGIAVVRKDGRPVDPWLLALRDLAHLLDTIPMLAGWFWPLWDSRGRTFADMITRTEVVRVAGSRTDYRPLAAKALAGIGVLALLGGGLGYFGVFRHENAVANARTEIAEQGPKIVPDVLSYSAASLDDDFARAQGLVTDAYRPQLVAQQDAVRKVTPVVDNEYWVTNSAVLSATADDAQMLMLMQGQRGAKPKQRFITATVRASFEKSSSGQWQLADLTVIAKPAPQGGQQGAVPQEKAGQPTPQPTGAPPAQSSSAPPAQSSSAPPAQPSQPNPPKQGR